MTPDPLNYFRRERRRRMLMPMQPVDDPSVVIVRPYGVAKGLGMTTPPIDYTLSHYGGTLRGAKIGQWRDTLMVAPDPQPVNAPTLFSWRSSSTISRVGQFWTPEDADAYRGSIQEL